MEIKFTTDQNVSIVEMVGKLDSLTSPAAQEQIMANLQPGKEFVINAARLEYVSSAGIRVLLLIAKKLAAQGGKAVLAGLSAEVKDVMAMTGFDHMFIFQPDVRTALSTLRKDA